ncbi:carboxypeptidase-like regulatory domain-containing protein [Streptomyces canus]|uniref:carboxypeptidase-like regulatory domain-containing protein n=1 Tax=Streptomyces canus TaxID=58343 RepID=UPI0036CCC52C
MLVGAGALRKPTEAEPQAAYASTGSAESVPATGGPSIAGQVRGAEGTGVDGATLTLISLTGRQLGRTVTRSDGRYSMPTPGSGSYVLTTAADGHRPQSATVVVGEEPLAYNVLLDGTSGPADGGPSRAR